MRPRIANLFWLIALLAIFVACESTAPSRDQNAPKIDLLLVPLNFDWATPDHLLPGLDLLTDEIVAQVELASFHCGRVPLTKVIKLWPAALQEVGGLVDPETSRLDLARLEAARGVLVRRLLIDHPAAGALLPTLVVREAEMNNGRASWDGVQRRIEVVRGLKFDSELQFTGRISATSLWTSLYTPTGEQVGSEYGGIEIMQSMQHLRKEPEGRDRIIHYYRWTDRDDLFQDPRRVRTAVSLSLGPVLEKARSAL